VVLIDALPGRQQASYEERALRALLPSLQAHALLCDASGLFPADDVAKLQECGAFALTLPVFLGERATSADVDQLVSVLTLTGEGSLALGRILEAHINALHLVARFGDPAQRERAMRDAETGNLFALWVTDPADGGGLTMTRNDARLLLTGQKEFCSAAGHATRALVTARDGHGEVRMLILSLQRGEHVSPLPAPLQGMRGAVTGRVDFTGYETDIDAVLGQPGDYLREPDFSTGAWRSAAVASGGLTALVKLAAAQLTSTGRLASEHSQARLGLAFVAAQTASMWVRKAACVAEMPGQDLGKAVAIVGLARTAVERACLDAIRDIQRSIGLSAFRSGTAMELLCRDLSTYLRQPAPDEVLTEAALWCAAHSGSLPL
jgi:alkylation response protein AidB-like acyl-CoA dehydrogenase